MKSYYLLVLAILLLLQESSHEYIGFNRARREAILFPFTNIMFRVSSARRRRVQLLLCWLVVHTAVVAAAGFVAALTLTC
jgi:hypothetical protein